MSLRSMAVYLFETWKVFRRNISHNGMWFSEPANLITPFHLVFYVSRGSFDFSIEDTTRINTETLFLRPSFLHFKLNMRLGFPFWELNCHDKKLLLKGEYYSQKDVKSTEKVCIFHLFWIKSIIENGDNI